MSITIRHCPQPEPHGTHNWQPEPRVLNGVKRCPGVPHVNQVSLGGAEEAEYYIEQLRDALDRAERRIERAERLIDSWEHDAPDHSNPVFIGRLRETLRRDPAPVRLREGSVPEHQVDSIADLDLPDSGCDGDCTGTCGEV